MSTYEENVVVVGEKDKEAPVRTRLNDLSRGKWLKYSVSIWYDVKYDKKEKILKKKHPAMFPLEIAKRLVETFTRESEWVLDPFSGTGTTLVACKMLGRNAYGFDISPYFTKLAKERVANQTAVHGSPTRQIPVPDDSRNLLSHIEKESIDFAITSPPYWRILREEKTFLKREATPYTELSKDLGNIQDYGEFLDSLADIFSKVYQVLHPGKFLVVDVMDIRLGDIFYPLHIDLVKKMSNMGFTLWDVIIWDRHSEYNNLTAMIYPYKFHVNKVHEYLLIFHKAEEVNKTKNLQTAPAKDHKSSRRQTVLFAGRPYSLRECECCKSKNDSFCLEKCPHNVWKKR